MPFVLCQAGAADHREPRARPGRPALIDDALREAGVEREQIDCLAIGLGPGSYTGVRAAIAVAQGWQLARGIRLLGVSTAETSPARMRSRRSVR